MGSYECEIRPSRISFAYLLYNWHVRRIQEAFWVEVTVERPEQQFTYKLSRHSRVPVTAFQPSLLHNIYLLNVNVNLLKIESARKVRAATASPLWTIVKNQTS